MQISLPWDGISVGDSGPFSSAEWAQGWRYLIGLASHRANVGVMLGSGDGGVEGLRVQPTTGPSANIEVTAGSALVNGTLFISDATETLAVTTNGSGNARIDTVILSKDFTAQTVRLVVKAGTPAASPVPPSLTQTANVLWEIPLYDIAVANGFLTITAADLTPRAEYANAADGVYLDMVLNNSGGELNTGDVVVWDTSANRAVTTTTSGSNPDVAGVWQGRTANGGYGRVLTDGIGLVRVNAAVASRGSLLATSTTAKQAAVVTGGGVFASTLETTSGAGLCLSYVRTSLRGASGIQFTQTASQTIANTTTETSLFGTGLGTLTLPANALAVGTTIRIRMSGVVSSTGANAPLRVKLGGTTLATSDALNFATITNRAWRLEVDITCRTTGATGTVIGQGIFWYQISTVAVNGLGLAMTATATIDTTTSLALALTAQWSAANPAHTITCTNATVELIEAA